MENNEKILKQKNSLCSEINISIGVGLAVLAVVFGQTNGFGATFSIIVAIYIGYKVLRLISRVLRLLFPLSFSIVSIAIFILTLSLLIS